MVWFWALVTSSGGRRDMGAPVSEKTRQPPRADLEHTPVLSPLTKTSSTTKNLWIHKKRRKKKEDGTSFDQLFL
jgi:hypothetical protein